VLAQLQACEQRRHSLVDLVHAVELLVTQARHDPPLNDLHRRFSLGLVLWMARTAGRIEVP
jgi:hypothetical protein